METASYSQAGQDLLVRLLTDFSPSGYFVDIGCSHPVTINNTYALEQLGWNGILIDYDVNMIELCRQQRRAPAVLANLCQVSLRDVFTANSVPAVIDYISFDVDQATEVALAGFPFDKYKFRIMTFEHDAYHKGPNLRYESRQIFQAAGYALLCADVKHEGLAYEDWYVDSSFDPSELARFRQDAVEYTEIFKIR